MYVYNVAISGDRKVIEKEAEKILKYKDLTTADRLYEEFKKLSVISCAVLLQYLSFLTSLSMPLVAISSTNRFYLPRLYLGEDTRMRDRWPFRSFKPQLSPYLLELRSGSVSGAPGVG
jgi:hypothetical protein